MWCVAMKIIQTEALELQGMPRLNRSTLRAQRRVNPQGALGRARRSTHAQHDGTNVAGTKPVFKNRLRRVVHTFYLCLFALEESFDQASLASIHLVALDHNLVRLKDQT